MISKETVNELINRATNNLSKAYAPYSKYRVGVALLAKSGKIYDGANIETAVYRASHGERVALDQAIIAGEREFVAIAVVTNDPSAPFPCGQCLQDLAEFDIDGKGELEIIAANVNGMVRKSTLNQLLPERFGPFNLGIDPTKN